MKKFYLLLLVFLFILNLSVFSQDNDFRDPLVSLLPKQKTAEEQEAATSELERAELNINLQGIIWGHDMPQVIIDGKVYKKGDVLSDIEAKIVKIDKGVVSIFYQGFLYEKSIKKDEEVQ